VAPLMLHRGRPEVDPSRVELFRQESKRTEELSAVEIGSLKTTIVLYKAASILWLELQISYALISRFHLWTNTCDVGVEFRLQ
jgi:hypothetical protein